MSALKNQKERKQYPNILPNNILECYMQDRLNKYVYCNVS